MRIADRISSFISLQATRTWVLTAIAALALATAALLTPATARAELRAFRLKITNSATGSQRSVITRFDHIQYPMYNHVVKTETIEIEQTWMCYVRSDYLGMLCPAPAPVAGRAPAGNTAPAAGLGQKQDQRPAAPVQPQR